MQLVMGLGNPGSRYADTRHNVGFRCLEAVARQLRLAFTDETPAYRAAVGEGPAGPLTLMQPLTYMNLSGEALVAWATLTGRRWREPLADDEGAAEAPVVPIVVCDDIQLPLGSIRIRAGGSDGGQNGLASILTTVGHQDVPRLRLGVGPLAGDLDPADWADYVLAPFAVDEEEAAAELIDCGRAALLDLLAHGPQWSASRHNRRVKAPIDLPEDD